MVLALYILALSLCARRICLSAIASSSPLPIVDLGYGRHQAISFHEDGSFYNFSNIRYAEAPVGDLRFRAPLPVQGQYPDVDNGSIGRVCPQGPTPWLEITYDFLPAYLKGQSFNYSAAEAALVESAPEVPLTPSDPRITEDCLFLDIYVPDKVFPKGGSKEDAGAPVLLWMSGGGYIQGDKNNNGQYNPSNLIKESHASGAKGAIIVSINYRLGAFGFLGGPTFQQDGTANAGLHDQRLALEWIQDRIHLFGGDRKRVTVFGESAGGGSIIHHITAYGGLRGPAPFAQAIPQSPAWLNMPGNRQQEQIFQAFLSRLNVTSIQDARRLSSDVLIKANAAAVAASPYGRYTFGPGVDGSFVPALPAQLLLHGQYDKTVKVMVGYNSDEGFLFTTPAVDSDAAFQMYIQNNFPDITAAVTNYLTSVLYPPHFDGSESYRTQFDRASVFSAEAAIKCNAFYLDVALANQTYGYEFAVYPAIHGQDTNYTWYHDSDPNPVVTDPGVARALQHYIVNFAVTGQPSGQEGGMFPHFPPYGHNATILKLNSNISITQEQDSAANQRCVWWQKGLYI